MPYNLEYLAIQTVALLITALLLPGLRISGPFSALITVIALAVVNTYIWDAALFFQVPDTISGHTLTLLIANGIVFWLLVKILPGAEITGCLPAIAGPVLFTLLTLVIQRYGRDIHWSEIFHSILDFITRLKSSLQGTSGAAR